MAKLVPPRVVPPTNAENPAVAYRGSKKSPKKYAPQPRRTNRLVTSGCGGTTYTGVYTKAGRASTTGEKATGANSTPRPSSGRSQ